MCSRGGGQHQNTSRERLIVKGHLYAIGLGMGCGEGDMCVTGGGDWMMNWKGRVVFIFITY